MFLKNTLAVIPPFTGRCFLFIFFFVLLFLPAASTVRAGERITSFISQVDVLQSGDLVVEETISVIAEGNRIRRGIYRDFPTNYSDENGHSYRVAFSVVSVERDGSEEPFHTRKINNGVRLYMGSEDVVIPNGPHTYTLRYVTNRQLGIFADHDELYWNVTGNGWSFTIDHAKVTITIPEPGGIDNFQWYTGRSGERFTKARLVARGQSFITMETTAPLPPGSGFTVVAAWPKGLVREPGRIQRWFWFVRDFFLSIAVATGLLVLVIYYSVSWIRVGRDPESGPIIPIFTPPDTISPAAGRYIMKMGFDQKSFAAVLVNMAVKGVLKIEQQDDEYTLHLLTYGVERLTPGELAVRKKLFKGEKTIELKQENNGIIRGAISGLKKRLRGDLLNIYFKQNRSKLLPGVFISLAVLVIVILAGRDVAISAFITLWLVGWSAGVLMLFLQMVNSWRAAMIPHSGFASKKKALAKSLFFLPFLVGLIFGSLILYSQVALTGVIILFLTIAINFLFAWLLKAPTLSGRQIMDQLEGLRMYLSVAEKERLNMFNPPEKTPELFEKMLPWALALDVEQQWCEQFADILDQVGSEQQQYHPAWYSSSHGFSSHSFSSALGGSLAASISSSSVAPGSSSGFSSGGGGGSSGGGGGGGGVVGW